MLRSEDVSKNMLLRSDDTINRIGMDDKNKNNLIKPIDIVGK